MEEKKKRDIAEKEKQLSKPLVETKSRMNDEYYNTAKYLKDKYKVECDLMSQMQMKGML